MSRIDELAAESDKAKRNGHAEPIELREYGDVPVREPGDDPVEPEHVNGSTEAANRITEPMRELDQTQRAQVLQSLQDAAAAVRAGDRLDDVREDVFRLNKLMDGFFANDSEKLAEVLGQTQTNAEMIAHAKPPNFLIRNFLTAGTLVVWAAPEKAWKTTLGHHAALVVGGHGKFLGLYENYVNMPSVYFSGESGNWPLKSMQERILKWAYAGTVLDFHGQPVSVVPAPSEIPITWGGDPPDLGSPETIPALKTLIEKTGAKLLILDPSQALFASISEDVKNDFAMRQYMKKLQLLARETGCCIVLLHHFRQHVQPGFPKRSDSSYGAFTKFCDTWVLMNQREEPTGDEEPGSGKLWITWGSRDGFGASHAIDIAEGTFETGRYFDLQVVDVGDALDDLAERKAERKGREQRAASTAKADNRKAEIVKELSGLTTGVTTVTLAGKMTVGRSTLGPTIAAMLAAGELVNVPTEYVNHGKLCWNTGLAVPETAEKIKALAMARGWRDATKPTGVTGVTGAESTPVTPAGTEGEPPLCRSHYTVASGTGGVDPTPGVIESEAENRHPLPSEASQFRVSQSPSESVRTGPDGCSRVESVSLLIGADDTDSLACTGVQANPDVKPDGRKRRKRRRRKATKTGRKATKTS